MPRMMLMCKFATSGTELVALLLDPFADELAARRMVDYKLHIALGLKSNFGH